MFNIDRNSVKSHHRTVMRDGTDPGFVQGFVESVAIDPEQRMVSGLITTAIKPGLDGMVVPASAFDLSYFWGDPMRGIRGIKTVYWNHDYNVPVGTCQALTLKHKGTAMFARTFITRTSIAEDVMTMIRDGTVRGFSCGFRIHEATDPTPEEAVRWPDVESVVRSATLLEYSIVAMPADPGSQIMADSEAERVYSGVDRLLTRGMVKRSNMEILGLLPKSRPVGKRSLIEIIDPPASRVSLV